MKKEKLESCFDFEAVRALELPKGKYAVFGSGPLAARGLKKAGDIDLIVTPDLFAELLARKEFTQKPAESGSPSLVVGDVEIFCDWNCGMTEQVSEMIATAEEIEGLPFVQLKFVAEWKRKYGREKDLRDLALIEKFLAKS